MPGIFPYEYDPLVIVLTVGITVILALIVRTLYQRYNKDKVIKETVYNQDVKKRMEDIREIQQEKIRQQLEQETKQSKGSKPRSRPKPSERMIPSSTYSSGEHYRPNIMDRYPHMKRGGGG